MTSALASQQFSAGEKTQAFRNLQPIPAQALPHKFSSARSWVYINCKNPYPVVASPYSNQMGSSVRDHMLPIWQLRRAFLSVPWMIISFNMKEVGVSLCPVLCWCSLGSRPPFRSYYGQCISDSIFWQRTVFLRSLFHLHLLVSKTQDLLLYFIFFL